MAKKKRIVDAREDKDGNISHVKLDGNQQFTSVDKVIEMTKRGEVDGAHVSHTEAGKEYLRTNPDAKKGNNLDDMAKD